MERNTKVRVKPEAPFHAGRIGYFQFLGDIDKDCAVLSAEPTGHDTQDASAVEQIKFKPGPVTLFVVHKDHVEEVKDERAA